MPKVRKEIPELEKLVQVGRKKFVRYEEGAQLYSMNPCSCTSAKFMVLSLSKIVSQV